MPVPPRRCGDPDGAVPSLHRRDERPDAGGEFARRVEKRRRLANGPQLLGVRGKARRVDNWAF